MNYRDFLEKIAEYYIVRYDGFFDYQTLSELNDFPYRDDISYSDVKLYIEDGIRMGHIEDIPKEDNRFLQHGRFDKLFRLTDKGISYLDEMTQIDKDREFDRHNIKMSNIKSSLSIIISIISVIIAFFALFVD